VRACERGCLSPVDGEAPQPPCILGRRLRLSERRRSARRCWPVRGHVYLTVTDRYSTAERGLGGGAMIATGRRGC
jgi:hypothetical protein